MIEVGLVRELAMSERSRSNALVNDDMAALADLLTDDLVHVHTTGIVQCKSELLAHASDFLRFVEVEHGPPTIRLIGENAAIITNSMTNTVRCRDTKEQIIVYAFVSQAWVKQDRRWHSSSFHATRLPATSTES
jgi:ketosteroid isomerase-like protein